MPVSFDIADRIFKSEKRLLRPLKWVAVDSKKKNEQRRNLECRVEVDGTIPRGIFFRIIIYPRSLSRATFQLECDLPSSRSHVPLYRFELEPERPHINKMYGSGGILGLYIEAGIAHEHVFYDSLTETGELRENACAQARIVANPPRDFPTALALVCRRINVVNGDEIQNPGDQGMLL